MSTIGTLSHKGFTGSIEYTEEDGVFFGKLQDVRGLVSYEGETLDTLYADFTVAVEEHIEFCIKKGIHLPLLDFDEHQFSPER